MTFVKQFSLTLREKLNTLGIQSSYINLHLKHLEGSNLLSVTWFEEQQVPQEIEVAQALDESDDEAIDCESEEEKNGTDIKN